jgi:argininosuccinate synthase
MGDTRMVPWAHGASIKGNDAVALEAPGVVTETVVEEGHDVSVPDGTSEY